MGVSYTQLRDGSWGLKVTGEAPTEGQQLRVVRKDGQNRFETVGRVLWKDDSKGVYLCTIGQSMRARRGVGRFCEECGEKIERSNQECWETGGTCYPERRY